MKPSFEQVFRTIFKSDEHGVKTALVGISGITFTSEDNDYTRQAKKESAVLVAQRFELWEHIPEYITHLEFPNGIILPRHPDRTFVRENHMSTQALQEYLTETKKWRW